MSTPSQDVLDHMRHMLRYVDAGLGALVWRHGRYKGELAGSTMSHTHERRLRLEGGSYSCAKVAWFLVHGTWPENRLRHLNRDREDIRVSNLEETSRREGPGR